MTMTTKKARVPKESRAKTQTKDTTKKTHEQQALSLLRRRKKSGVTSWDLIVAHRNTRASSTIYCLRRKGYGIRTEIETKNGKTYGRYYLEYDKEAENK